ncbi:MAG: LytTR family DNA-binding domain-containing protein [Marinilabiliaceae bacterium]|nr:LytTR family DNA-binding domain-containing protein [Marinilabiliaceae bacterium]
MTIKTIAIDDEPLALHQVSTYIQKVPFLEFVDAYPDALTAMREMEGKQIDLMFVDINMPDLNGLTFVQNLNPRPLVVFTTAYSKYAIDGYKVEAVDYLLKPFSFDQLLAAAEKARRRLMPAAQTEKQDDGSNAIVDGALFVRTDGHTVRVQLSDIKYIESMSEYVRIYLLNKEKPLTPLISMHRLEELLPSDTFMRVHRSYIVNLSNITDIQRLRIVYGKEFIPVGDNYKDAFVEYINKHSMK